MKTSVIFIFLLLINSFYAKAQFYEVNDKDGFVNVRDHPGANSPVICRLDNNTIVLESFTEDTTGSKNWIHVDFYLPLPAVKEKKLLPDDFTPPIMTGYKLVSGFIYRSRLLDIEELDEVKQEAGDNRLRFYNDSISLTIATAAFRVKDHAITFMKESPTFYEKVDHLPMIGTDGDKPVDEISKIEMTINKKPVLIGRSFYKNLFNPNLLDSRMYTDGKGNFYVVMYNSDAAGSYSCIFVFRNGKFVERLVFEGEH